MKLSPRWREPAVPPGEALLLLRWADTDAAATKWAAAADDWRSIARDISEGKETWVTYRNDLPDLRTVRAVALAAGRVEEARALVKRREGARDPRVIGRVLGE